MKLQLHENPSVFGQLPRVFDLAEARFALLPVPYDGTATWQKGASDGPQAIFAASANMELYDILTASEPWHAGIVAMAPLPRFERPEPMVAAVTEATAALIADGRVVVGIGGEHSISIGLIAAHADHYPGLNVLQFDAHADTRPEYDGSPLNHACVMARVVEMCPCVQVGIRSMDASEIAQIDPDRVYYAHRFTATDAQIEAIVGQLAGPVYITIDLDVLDPAEMPSTGTPEPGGLRYWDVVKVLAAVCARHRVVGFDVVELAPNPANRAPDFLAARLIYQLMALIHQADPRSRP